MQDQGRPYRPPLLYRSLIVVAGWVVPRAARKAWRAGQDARLFDWWLLAQRGEMPRRDIETANLLRGALQDAMLHRIHPQALLSWLRGPAFPLLSAAALFTLFALVTRGFAYTRHLVELACQVLPGPPDLRTDVLVGHIFILAVSVTAGLAMALIRRPPPHVAGWLYWSYFALQCAAVLVMIPLLWIEGGAALRACFPRHEGMRALATLLVTLAYLPSLATALAWVLADQRARCPVCLRRLDLPVTLGSWSSVFDPSSTELLCDQGHGALVLPESSIGAPERWTRLDDSWKSLFSQSAG